MDRAHFIRLGLVASLGLVTGVVHADQPAKAEDTLESWAGRHGGSLSLKNGELRIVARAKVTSFGDALQELAGLADGVLRCHGRTVTGLQGGRSFRVLLRAA
ncbi:hypothetical protein OKA04_16265 [Luteolibacter flavescens]|uniref:Uncharacterized protein n=1 Tax=Luteolibacter flavescens TaxID=1859460 RepID=A0ABT3FRU4_9BACT|nr:hypothetical protein [Luteolibacter flavescens]MCW1886293.1 hypothetical protein [Luteolibacter flavescens]